MSNAQPRQAFYADRCRQQVDFKVGDDALVHKDFLYHDVIRSQQYAKLQPVLVGPFKVIRKLPADVMELNSRTSYLPSASRIQRFCFEEISSEFCTPCRTQPPAPSLMDLQGPTRFIVERVLSSRRRYGKRQLLVMWTPHVGARGVSSG